MTDSEIEIHGSGRTDAGVHALQQVANFKCDTPKTPDQIMEYLNTYLPLDIRITSIWEAAPRFHARLNATKKHYRYIIDTNPYQDVFTRKYATHLPENYDLHARYDPTGKRPPVCRLYRTTAGAFSCRGLLPMIFSVPMAHFLFHFLPDRI